MISEGVLSKAKILIIDDEIANIRFLEIILQQAGYKHVFSSTNPLEAVSLFRGLTPDIVLLDLNMPELDGFAVMRQLQAEISNFTIPILVLTADVFPATKHRALREGAMDFLTKPLDEVEVLLRINHLLQTRFHSALLEAKVRERTGELEKAQLETLQRLAIAAEYRDDETGLHTKRVGVIAGRIAQALGLPRTEVDLIRRTAPLHDIGKIGIADGILLKPGRLSNEEFETMKQHTVIGAEILTGSSSPWLKMAAEIALCHHERWDGEGYPNGVAGSHIPLVGRIVAVADVFDALTHERPYKAAWPIEQAMAELATQKGKQLDGEMVEAFMSLPHEVLV